MRTEVVAITNKSGSSVRMEFDAVNVVEDANGIGIRIPTELDSKSLGKKSVNLWIQAYKVTYPTRVIFLQRVEECGKSEVRDWMRSSSDELGVLPKPDGKNLWSLSIE
jgi:hypothetical protein